ncbi:MULTISPECIES: xanthine dehydrogenase family protein molybdopterin-binding subunit [Inquilinus]|uniref:Carbon-monoxide dehydrogenase large subunit n=1 Tax=Inquilinus ginsengisoli TaxID=363840 RepID=A0ABU1JWS7_9PROT|nr:xanthine dehydrogenase family protein molybdopterin-binding subunit [Inquilinus ginsengisoli]MDR6293065.1 carbon-monoxide dehydrogenase large subunit [Inquilinus ginsengisoli]
MAHDGIGAPLRRKEDFRFLTGNGHYTDDINRPGQAFAYFLRSPVAHARIRSIDTSAAAAAPGVVAIFTGDDLAKDKIGGLICGWMVKSKNGEPMKAGPHPALAQGKVRYVGDHVAVVIAETKDQAKDAAEKIEVDYEELPAVVATNSARKAGAALVHDDIPANTVYEWELGNKADVEAAFARASHVTKLDLENNRLIPNAMEPRAAIGEYDRGSDSFTLHTTSQNPHVARLVLSAFIGIAPEHKLRVIAPDVGGGFGSKIFIYAEETVCVWAAKKVGRPVKWTGERSESFLADAHGRDHVTHAELAMDQDGKFLALRVHTTANLGAYLSTFASCVPTYLYAPLLSGQYAIPAIYAEVDGVYTNTAPVDAYRGAGRPEATYVIEHIVELAAREMKLDPAEIRRRNFVQPTQYPYQTPVIMTYDCGDYPQAMTAALKLADYDGFPARKAESAGRGKLRGIGFSSYIEACGIAPSAAVGSLGAGVGLWESAKIRFNPTGNVTVHTGSHSHGQGHETTFAQLMSSYLGVPADQVEVVHGDTDKTPFGMGTYGSRSLAVGGSAIVKAAEKIIAKGKKIAAHQLEAAEADIEFKDGKFTVAGTDRAKTIQEVAFAAYVPHNYPAGVEPGLEESAFYDPINFTFPAGTQICEVEVDPDTGIVTIANYSAVDDFGRVINPMIVEGQVHGGLAQGLGQAMMENCAYDLETGQLLTGSFMDYCMPRADDLPSFNVGMIETVNPSNPLGVKGCGEAGAIAAPPALMNAITDAIGRDMNMPATPERVWRAIHSAPALAAE